MSSKITFLSAGILFAFTLTFYGPSLVRADVGQLPPPAPPSTQDSQDPLAAVKAEAQNQLNQLPDTTPQAIVGQVIRILMAFMGAIMFLLVVYGGFLWMTAQGNSEKIEKAKQIIVWAALGTAVIFASYILVNYVFTQLSSS